MLRVTTALALIAHCTWLWRDDFGGSAWFTRSVEFRRDAAGKVVGFSVFVDDRSRDIRFTKRR
jgi:hypothetical protein